MSEKINWHNLRMLIVRECCYNKATNIEGYPDSQKRRITLFKMREFNEYCFLVYEGGKF